jgi:hypothetical protein
MSSDRYASVPERITWTTGFRVATDKVVLGALSTFANFETGKGARVRVKKLAARAELKPRTVQRALHRLEADGWIVAVRRQHKGATSWDIQVERLATTWVAMKAVGGVMPSFAQGDKKLNVTDVVQLNVTDVAQLNDTAVVQESFLNVTDVVQLNVTDVVQIPCTERSPVEPIPSAPALRAGMRAAGAEEREEAHAPPATPPDPDLRADRRDHPDDAAGRVAGRGSHHSAAPGTGLHVPQGPDLPSAGRAPESSPRVGPQQEAFRLFADVNASVSATPSEEQHRRFMEDLRSRCGLPASADADAKERKSG